MKLPSEPDIVLIQAHGRLRRVTHVCRSGQLEMLAADGTSQLRTYTEHALTGDRSAYAKSANWQVTSDFLHIPEQLQQASFQLRAF